MAYIIKYLKFSIWPKNLTCEYWTKLIENIISHWVLWLIPDIRLVQEILHSVRKICIHMSKICIFQPMKGPFQIFFSSFYKSFHVKFSAHIFFTGASVLVRKSNFWESDRCILNFPWSPWPKWWKRPLARRMVFVWISGSKLIKAP